MLPNNLHVSPRITPLSRIDIPCLYRIEGLNDEVGSDRLDSGQKSNEVDESLCERCRRLGL
jgi:hypothetical protein